MYITTQRRGGGKKKTLLKTRRVTLLDDPKAQAEESRRVFFARFSADSEGAGKYLDTWLSGAVEIAENILADHNLPTTWPEIMTCVRNYEIPLFASYAADILFLVREVRNCIQAGDAGKTAVAALWLGDAMAACDAEQAAGGRESKRTGKGRAKNEEKAKARRERMAAIAAETFNWQPGQLLKPAQRRAINIVLMKEYQAKDRPTSQDMSADALELGMRRKKN